MRSRCTIRPLCFVLRKGCWVLALTVTLTLASASPTRAGSMDVNGAAFGSFTVNVWCSPNAPPAAPTYTSTDGAAGGVFFPSASLGPNLKGCNAATQITGSARAAAALFGANVKYTQGGGDITGYGGQDLLPYVTPTHYISSGSFDLVESVVNSHTVAFTGSIFASDPGVAMRFEGFDISNPTSPILLATTGVLVGPFNNTNFTFTISGIPNTSGTTTELLNNVQFYAEGIGTSIPEPGSAVLLALGLGAGVLAVSRRRARREGGRGLVEAAG